MYTSPAILNYSLVVIAVTRGRQNSASWNKENRRLASKISMLVPCPSYAHPMLMPGIYYFCSMTGIKNIIFDLGGVVLDINFALTNKAFEELELKGFANHITQHHITPLFEAYETGKIDDAAFIKG